MWNEKFNNVVILADQYRMNEAISRIINEAFYPEVNYVPANDSIGKHTLKEFLEPFTPKQSLDKKNLSSQIFDYKIPVVLLNSEKDSNGLEGVEETDIQTESRFNVREAKIIGSLLAEFLLNYSEKDQISIAKQIGVISPYRHQNNQIYAELRAKNFSDAVIAQIRVDTVDRYQGDEREIIILSLTNSNELNAIGQLHREWRRMNVSISRAKAKLVIVGNKHTFISPSSDEKETEAKEKFKKMFDTINELKKEQLALELPTEKMFTED